MIKFLTSQPFGILGALSLIGLLQVSLTLHEFIDKLVNAWQAIAIPVFNYCFWWIEISDYWEDYFIVGFIFASARTRLSLLDAIQRNRILADQFKNKNTWKILRIHFRVRFYVSVIRNFLFVIVTWPLETVIVALSASEVRLHSHMAKDSELSDYSRRYFDAQRRYVQAVLSFVVWTAIILAISYSLIQIEAFAGFVGGLFAGE